MNPERARELLGGLASGILTPEEKQVLFEAALHDQTLFNEVADEMELAAFLQSPETRSQLANRIPDATLESSQQRWRIRPGWLALAGSLAASIVLFFAVGHRTARVTPAPSPVAAAPAAAPSPNVQLNADLPPKAAPQRAATESARTRNTGNARSATASSVAALKDANVAKPETQDKLASNAPPPPARPQQQRLAYAARNAGVGGAPSMPSPPVTASLEGNVHDVSGAAVPNATIDIVNSATKQVSHTASDRAGRFIAPALQPGGPYTVTATAPGFKKEERPDIALAANQTAQVDIPLQVGSASETVEVTAAAPALAMTPRAKQTPNPESQIAVLDFANSTAQHHSGQQAADLLSTQLLDGGQVRVIDRDKVQQAQQAQSQSQQKPPTPKQAAALGRSLGADAVIVGSVRPADSSSNVAISAEVIDTKKARPMAKAAASAGSLQAATNSLGNQIQSQLAVPLEGVVTRADQDTISVTFNSSATPSIGQRFDVFRSNKRKIGELTLTSAYGQTGVGKFTGTAQPRPGDHIISSR